MKIIHPPLCQIPPFTVHATLSTLLLHFGDTMLLLLLIQKFPRGFRIKEAFWIELVEIFGIILSYVLGCVRKR